MAVYKSTFCYPFLNNIDIRTVSNESDKPAIQWLKCKISTSNKNVTGYKIRILDNNNSQIFPLGDGKISPISELEGFTLPENAEVDANTGINGTFLYIPFFQNANAANKLDSYNSIYFDVNYYADYFIPFNQMGNWYTIDGGDTYFNNDDWGKDINGETCSLGQYICLQKESSGNYSYSLYQITNATTITKIADLDLGEKILITKGSYHNQCFKNGNSASSTTFSWEDYSNDLINLSLDISLYKWEVILYQGTIDNPQADLMEVTYNNLSNDWFDQVLTSGTILGSTSKRIQVAKEFSDGWKIPNTSMNNPLVLQGKWVELLDSEGNTIKSRAYIQNYDASLGHIYPKTGYFTAQDIKDASLVRFYNLSNNPSEILDSDSVVCATTENENIAIYRSDYSDFEECSLTPSIDGWNLSQGDHVLIMNQNNSEENGIYTYNAISKWSRSVGCETWGSLIGKKIFVKNGSTNGGKNFQSQAFAGGSLLFANNSRINSTGSPLYWIEEQPILLYDEDTENIDFFETVMSESSTSLNATEIDGVNIELGETVYYINNSAIDGHIFLGQKCTYEGDGNYSTENLDPSKLYKIKKGKQTGNIYKYDGNYFHSTEPNYSLYTVKILKNELGKAFVSPFIGLEKGQKFKFTNTTVGTPAIQWIKINDIDKNIWKISYDSSSEILEPFPSEDESGVNKSIPYKYEIRTFFNSSDENPFNIYEQPYLNIQCSFGPFNYDAVNERQITLEGKYIQHQQTSWESYRWVLYNHIGEIIQDSGKQYDKEMKVSFYGLSAEQSENQNHYIIGLYVEDNLGNIISQEIPIIVSYPLGENTDIQLVGEYDCENQSVKLEIIGNKKVDLAGKFEGNSFPIQVDNETINYGDSVLDLNSYLIYKNLNKELDPTNKNSWTSQEWTFEGEGPIYEGVDYFKGSGIWKDGEDIYFSYVGVNPSIEFNYKLNLEDKKWIPVTISWDNYNNEEIKNQNSCVWRDSQGNLYYDDEANGHTHLKFDRESRSWQHHEWFYQSTPGGTSYSLKMTGEGVWEDGNIRYYSRGSGNQYKLDPSISEEIWQKITWTGALTSIYGVAVWKTIQEPKNIYCSMTSNYQTHTYKLDRDNQSWEDLGILKVQIGNEQYDLSLSNMYSIVDCGQVVFCLGAYSTEHGIERGYFLYSGNNIWTPANWGEVIPNQADNKYAYWAANKNLYYTTNNSQASENKNLKLNNIWTIEGTLLEGEFITVKRGKEYGNKLFQLVGSNLYPLTSSIYKRERDLFENKNEYQYYTGEWEPVFKGQVAYIQDFNIKSGFSYQYILYSGEEENFNSVTSYATKEAKEEAEQINGDIYRTNSQYWSISELKPIASKDPQKPIVENEYEVDLDNIWLFKYDTEVGSQNQNITKNEINSLGIYPKVGFGVKNYLSGDISCLLGDEIIPYSNEGYIERLRSGIKRPLSTNEKVRMLNKWREMVYSRNPKLLKDNKGQSWIVQIFSSSNSPYSHYINQPDKISFSWKQINSTDNCIIYGKGGNE